MLFVNRAAKKLTDARVPHVLATVDATQEPQLATKYGVKGYPTLKLFRRGQEVDTYTGGRKTKDLFDYISTKSAQARDEL